MVDTNALIGALVGVCGFVVVVLGIGWLTAPPFFPLKGKVVVITGGSSGIGKACAKEALRQGAHVAMVARKLGLLQEAVSELQPTTRASGTRLTAHAADVGSEAAMLTAFASIAAAHEGRVDVLINSAGMSVPKTFIDCGAAEFEQLYRVNVVGTRNATFAALPYMQDRRSGGRVVFVSSQAGQTGIYGYSAYAATKFALRGMFESLSQELYPRNILLSLAFPPDTDTPMLAEENKTKPYVTKLLSAATTTVPPEEVARGILDGVKRWAPYIPVGFDGWMLSTLTVGMGPAGSLPAALVQVSTLWLWRLVALGYLQYFYYVVQRNEGKTGAGEVAAAAEGAPPAEPAAPSSSKAAELLLSPKPAPSRRSSSGAQARSVSKK